MRLAWLTDIHLNCIRFPNVWWTEICAGNYDAFVITGDIAESSLLPNTLEMFAQAAKPVYFVLGNHDYYGGSIEKTRSKLTKLSDTQVGEYVKYLNNEGVIELTPQASLIGDDGWYDGRNGSYSSSSVELNDFYHIREFKRLGKYGRLQMMQKYADASARRLGDMCSQAVTRKGLEHLYIATHVPPFAGAAWHMGQPSDEFFQPFFSSQIIGETLIEATAEFRVCGGKVTILCGHSHGAGEIFPSSGMIVRTGGAEYGKPDICDIIEIQ